MNDSTLTSWAEDDWPAYTADEILPGLFQGGTEDDEVLGYPAPSHHYERMYSGSTPIYPFDVVITLYADAQPAPWGVHEVRYGFPDGPLRDHDLLKAVRIAKEAHRQWRSGAQVLIRCQAGVNRSGLISALVLMIDGCSAPEAIALLRSRRSPFVLSNSHFEKWLRTQAADFIAAHIAPHLSINPSAA
jgi:hypothetical protein